MIENYCCSYYQVSTLRIASYLRAIVVRQYSLRFGQMGDGTGVLEAGYRGTPSLIRKSYGLPPAEKAQGVIKHGIVFDAVNEGDFSLLGTEDVLLQKLFNGIYQGSGAFIHEAGID
jgi:hypothetical protein